MSAATRHSSTGEAFLTAVNPALAIMQVGENRYGHPSAGTLARLAGRLVLRNEQDRWVEITSDGRHM
jgi:beta-lactamase superfamily II metal-dependent hydrolase